MLDNISTNSSQYPCICKDDEMEKSVLFINQYASDLKTGFGGRSYYLSKELVKQGYKSGLVSSDFSHLQIKPEKNTTKYSVKNAEGTEHVKIRVLEYHQTRSLKRIVNWFLFSWRILGVSGHISFKPRVIICSSPSIFSIWGAWLLARKNGAKLIFEVRDIWPLTVLHLGKYTKNHPLIRLMTWSEKFALKHSDGVIGFSSEFKTYLNDKGYKDKKFICIPNGFDFENYKNLDNSPRLMKKAPDQILVGYLGTLGDANAVETLIEAAAKLKSDERFLFAIVGSGGATQKLKKLVEDLKAHNVHFFEQVPKYEVPGIIQQFDVGYIGWRNKALYNYGISPNKLSEYLGVGVPIAHCYSGKGDLVTQYQAGFTVPAEDSEALSQGLRKFAEMAAEQRDEMSRNGRAAAKEKHDFRILAKILDDFMKNKLN